MMNPFDILEKKMTRLIILFDVLDKQFIPACTPRNNMIG